MTSTIDFTTEELALASNAEILLLKKKVQGKVYELLNETAEDVDKVIDIAALSPFNNMVLTKKISKGENYLGLPYMVLDHPAYFSKEHILAFRTMFYWGNFFSTTLHLQGDYLEAYRQAFFQHAHKLIGHNVFISTGKGPWHYHYGADNYVLLTKQNLNKILEDSFIKLSLKIKLADWNQLPKISAQFYKKLQTILST